MMSEISNRPTEGGRGSYVPVAAENDAGIEGLHLVTASSAEVDVRTDENLEVCVSKVIGKKAGKTYPTNSSRSTLLLECSGMGHWKRLTLLPVFVCDLRLGSRKCGG
jgi:hypothetical protein